MSNIIHDGPSNVDPLYTEKVVYQPHEDKIYRQVSQTNHDAICNRNLQLQKEEQKKLDWGRMVGSVPSLIWDQWVNQYPELRGNDRIARDRRIIQLLKDHPQYTVVPKNKI